MLKINNDLERIGDLAVNIARAGDCPGRRTPDRRPLDLAGMADKVQDMLATALDALVNFDVGWPGPSAPRRRGRRHEPRDVRAGQGGLRKNPEHVNALMHLLSVSRHLERIADHATNIAEDVIYLIEGDIVRHKQD